MASSWITQAMIFAAGLGTRMRPLSDRCPKVLLPCGGQPILWYHLDALSALGVPRILVNASYLADQIVEAVEAWCQRETQRAWRPVPKVTVHYEATPLGTGGALVAVRPWITSEHLLVMNADCLWGPPYLPELIDALRPSVDGIGPCDGLALFVPLSRCHTEKTKGDAVIIEGEVYLRPGEKEGASADWLFTGMQWLRFHAIMEHAKATGLACFSTVDAWTRNPESGKLPKIIPRVTTADFWDLGTPALYEQACARWEGAADAKADR